MKIGLFFGTYNPIHNGHVMLATYLIENTDLSEIQFVISPDSPFKEHDNLVSFDDRFYMVASVCRETQRLGVTDIECQLPKPTYTINTLNYLKQSFPDNEYILILGADNFANLTTFHAYEDIIKNYTLYVVNRNNINCYKIREELYKKHNCKSIKIIYDAPQTDLSSTFIRNQIKSNKSIYGYVPYCVENCIDKLNLYKNNDN